METDRSVSAVAQRSRSMGTQRGVVLIFALMALFAMSMAGIAFMRSVDSTGIMAGNLAFSRASVSITDIGMEAARKRMVALDTDPRCANTGTCTAWMLNPADATKFCTPWGSGTPSRLWYWGNWQTFADNYRDYDWTNACYVAPADEPVVGTPEMAGYRITYIVHRMCQNTGDPFAGGNTCVSGQARFGGGDFRGSIDYVAPDVTGDVSTVQPYYRITVRVTGPRNSETYAVGWML